MGEFTGISWTDHTFNPWWGCSRVSPGCDHCYAEELDKRWYPLELWSATEDQPAKIVASHWGNGSPRRTFGEKHWNEPLRWNRKAKEAGVKRKVFCASMADIFDVKAPEGQRERLWELIRKTDCLIWQLLTKRVEGYRDMPGDLMCCRDVWKGFTAERNDPRTSVASQDLHPGRQHSRGQASASHPQEKAFRRVTPENCASAKEAMGPLSRRKEGGLDKLPGASGPGKFKAKEVRAS